MSTIIIDWKFKERPVTSKKPKKMWLARMMHAVKVGYKTVPWVTLYEVENWCMANDFDFTHETVDQLCADNGLMVHSWGPGCVYFKKAQV